MSDLVEIVRDALTREASEKQVVDFPTCARIALTAIEKAGHKIVPVEPTPEMMAAPEGAFPEGTSESIKQSWRDVYAEHYRLMLAAAPKVTP